MDSLFDLNIEPGSTSSSATIAWKDLSIYEDSKPHRRNTFECILRNAAGIVYPGQLLPIISSNPKEKTTLLQVLAYRLQNNISISGQIVINGINTGNFIRKITGYVYKNYSFCENITVLEHLMFLARINMDRRLSNCERKRRITQILSEVVLGHAEFMKIKCLNRGERRRLAIATEILTDPSVLFCDDPIYKLDNFSAQQIVGILKNIAANGKTVIVTLDRPNSQVFSMLDQIMIIGNARLIYTGPVHGGIAHFELFGYVCPEYYSIHDFFLSILTQDPNDKFDSEKIIKQVADNFIYSDGGQDFEFQIDNEIDRLLKYTHSHPSSNSQISELGSRFLQKCPSWPVKTTWLTQRVLLNYYRDPLIQKIRFYQIIFLGLIVGLCFPGIQKLPYNQLVQALNGVVFILISEISCRGILLALVRSKNEFSIFLQEKEAQSYNENQYFGSKLASMIPNCIIEAGIFTCISYFIIGLEGSISSFLYTFLIMLLTGMCGNAFGFAIVSANPDSTLRNPLGITIVTIAYIFLTVSSGLFFNFKSAPNATYWIKYISWFYYSFNSLKITQLESLMQVQLINFGNKENYTFENENWTKKLHDTVLNSEEKVNLLWNFDVTGIVVIYIVLISCSYVMLRLRCSRLYYKG